MPSVPIDGRKQHEKWIVEVVNAMNGREPTAGVAEVVPGGNYILDKWPAPSRASYGSGQTLPPLEPEPEKPMTPGRALWPNLK
jgi:hypothetical protein